MVDDADLADVRALRAERRALRNKHMGILGTALMAALGIIVQLVQVLRADAEKGHLSEKVATKDADLVALQKDIDSLSGRLTKCEGTLFGAQGVSGQGLTDRLKQLETIVDERLPKKK